MNSVQYAMVEPGIDYAVELDDSNAICENCHSLLNEEGKIEIANSTAVGLTDFVFIYPIPINNDQSVRVHFNIYDYIGVITGGASHVVTVYLYLSYVDLSQSERQNISCADDCINGRFDGLIDLKNYKNDPNAQLVIGGQVTDRDLITVMDIELGNLMQKNQRVEESIGIISDDCSVSDSI